MSRRAIGEAMTLQFVLAAVRLLTVGASDDVMDDISGDGDAVGLPTDPYQRTLERDLKPLLQGLARVRYRGRLTDGTLSRPTRCTELCACVVFLSQVKQMESTLQALQKRLVTRGDNNEIKTFVSTVDLVNLTVSSLRFAFMLIRDADGAQNVTESLRSIVPPEEFPDPTASGGISQLLESLSPQSFLLVLSLLNDALLQLLKRSQGVHELVERVLDVVETSASAAAVSEPAATSVEDDVNVDKLRAVNSGVVAVVNTRIQSHVSKLVSLRAQVSSDRIFMLLKWSFVRQQLLGWANVSVIMMMLLNCDCSCLQINCRVKVDEFVQLYGSLMAFCSAADSYADMSGNSSGAAAVGGSGGHSNSSSALRVEMSSQVREHAVLGAIYG